MASSSNSSSSSSTLYSPTLSTNSSIQSTGIPNVALVLLREPFEVPNGRRSHTRFIDESNGRAIYFTQARTTCNDVALFLGRDKIGQCSDKHLEFRDVKVPNEKLYKAGFFSSRPRSWKAPDGTKYSWLSEETGTMRLINVKTNQSMVLVQYLGSTRTRIIISAHVVGFGELVLLTMIQQEFENERRNQKKQAELEDLEDNENFW